MLKILFIIDSLGPAGKERQLVETIKGLDKRSDIRTALVLLNDHIHYKEIFDLNCKIQIIERRSRRDPIVFLKLYKICKDFKPDIIHSWERMCTIYTLPIAKLLHIKFINGVIQNATLIKRKHTKRWWQDRISFYFSDKIVGNTATGLKNYDVPKNKGYYVYNGFDLDRVKNLRPAEEIRQKFRIKTPFVVGMVARFDHRKDYTTFIQCGIELVKKRKDITFVAVGDDAVFFKRNGLYKIEDYKKMVPENYRDRIIFTGPQSEIESIINVFTLGVLLTNYLKHGEGISNSIIEYLALKKPVISTDAGGTPEIIENGKNGYLIQKNDPHEIMNKIEFLLDNPSIAKKMGEYGEALIRNKFNLNVMTENFIRLYTHMVPIKKNVPFFQN